MFDPTQPLVFLHIPKTGGSALAWALAEALKPKVVIHGWDRSLFGEYCEFDSWDPRVLESVFLTQESLPLNGTLVMGHISASTVRHGYPTGQVVLVLREPWSRLLSLWVYWRGKSELGDLHRIVGSYSDMVGLSKLALRDFLRCESIAPQIDNVVTRMLLWPDALLPDCGFIRRADDAALLTRAKAVLDSFECTQVYEDKGWVWKIGEWLGQTLVSRRVNETERSGEKCRARLDLELTPETCDLLQERSRIDSQLWTSLARKRLPHEDITLLEASSRLASVARFATLLDPVAADVDHA